ncbi:hypothetical protein [Rhizobium tumorigenes]|uniref:Uncharacterized protein n=1 Tax=Rhizobium tumorigenes TaxID=2041385 RepID=A0AAF1K3R5_9HYPH|nr:hypothetical protein [Rhizobium tumorigenes]WFR95114.1 hypothetical protein PR017_15105 [Rhizobium tumorigenes]
MNRFKFFSMALVALLLSGAADAADFAVMPLKDGDSFTGCLAQNIDAGVGLLAVGDKVVLFANSPKFTIAKGDEVKGTWSVDGGVPTDFSSTADTDATATIDVPNTTEAVTAFTTGKTLAVKANTNSVEFPLEGVEKAFTGLTECTQTQKAPE